MGRENDFQGRTICLTGGASGMGLSVAKHLIEQGWNVMIVDYNEESGHKAVQDLGDRALFTHANVMDYDKQAKAFVATWKQWSRLDFVFANAVSQPVSVSFGL